MKGALTLCCRFFLSFFFVLSGVIKLLDPGRFYLDVKAFELLPLNAAYGVALILPVFELVAAAGLWIPALRRGAAAVLGLSILAFIGALLLSYQRGLDLACGCFGEWLVFPSLSAHIGFNTGLALMSLWLFVRK